MYNRKDRLKILVAEDKTQYHYSLIEAILSDSELDLVGSTSDGYMAVKIADQNPVELVLIDLELPYPGGIHVLEEIRLARGTRPVCVTISDEDNDGIRRKALQEGADFSIIKPVNAETLLKKVKEIYEFKRQTTFRSQQSAPPEQMEKDAFIEYALTKIPIAANLKGYAYLQVGIALAIEDLGVLRRVTRGLYPEIALHFNSTASRVERSMRHAINLAWERGFGENYISLTETPLEGKPSNSTFIGAIAQLYQHKYRKR
ncbi:MAG: response regulator [Clostridiales bacterium]|jgi:two-component system response regulator (stage 0 sporulation protein A)|nr:response regulator [Clostridiales bacterium]MDR2751101.1 response regulator [Clostridiales bacterium]